MNSDKRKEHWEEVFKTKDTTKVSWHQPVPVTSIKLIETLHLPKSAKIIDAGCGDSYLPDHLLEKGYNNITLVDISEKALATVKQRLGGDAKKIHFQISDVTKYKSTVKFDLWHDRAVFHFLTKEDDIQDYLNTVNNHIKPGGYLIIGTFSENGPDQCSGLHVQQYSEDSLTKTFNKYFKRIKCFTENHTTPSGGIQNFLFCLFKKY